MSTNQPPPRRALLLTTPASAADPRRHLGSADYSYGFVERALRPVLESIALVQRVDRAESRLSWAAAQARMRGLDPVHLSLCPLHAVYPDSNIATICFPFWEFPRIPDRDFCHDTRQNWARIARAAGRIVCACQSTAAAFRAAGAPHVDVIPVPINPQSFAVPAWEPRDSTTLECRHIVLGADVAQPHSAASLGGSGPSQLLRRVYNNRVRPLLSKQALERMKHLRRRMLRMPDLTPQRLPVGELHLRGLTYLSVFNFSDRRKNARDMLTAFLLAFRQRSDVTLVWKLATNPATEADELDQLHAMHASLGIEHRCRVVVIADFLDDESLERLYRASSFYLNASRGEGACLPLQQALASGTPAVAPACSAMRDYMDEEVGFTVAHSDEPTYWPHDPEKRIETTWARLSWASLRDRLIESARVAVDDMGNYRRLSTNARQRMRPYGDQAAIAAAWQRVIDAA